MKRYSAAFLAFLLLLCGAAICSADSIVAPSSGGTGSPFESLDLELYSGWFLFTGNSIYNYYDQLDIVEANIDPTQTTSLEDGPVQEVVVNLDVTGGVVSSAGVDSHLFVPEPSSWFLLLTGCLLVGAAVAFRRKAEESQSPTAAPPVDRVP